MDIDHLKRLASEDPDEPGPSPAPGATFGRYRIERELGRGGTAVVFLARDTTLDRPIALKVLQGAGDDPRIDARAHREARAAAKLSHPAIIRVHEVGEIHGRPFVAMDFIDGPTFRKADLSLRQAVAALRDVAHALSEAHAAGIVHRDVKPENILVDTSGRPCLADFGLARLRGNTMTVTREGRAAGTPRYMSPEQLRGEMDHPQIDVYALGVMLYERLAGRPPFDGTTPEAVLRAILEGEAPRPSSVASGVDRELEAVCLRAMALDLRDRTSTARGFAEDLDRWLRGENVHAHPPSRWSTIKARARRHPRVVALSGGLLVALGAVLALSWTAWSTRQRSREVAEGVETMAGKAIQGFEHTLLGPPEPLDRDRAALEQTATLLRRMRRDHPEIPETLISLGRIEARLGRLDEAERLTSRGLVLLGSRARGEHFLARALVNAERLLDLPLMLDSREITGWRHRLEPVAARTVSDLERALDRGIKGSDARIQYLQALIVLSEFDVEECDRLCAKALSGAGVPPLLRADLLRLQGVSRLLRRDLDGASRAFDAAAGLKRRDVRCLLGSALSRVRSRGDALASGLRAIEDVFLIDPEYAPAWMPAAFLWAAAGDEAAERGEDPWPHYDRALEAFARADDRTTSPGLQVRLAGLRVNRAEALSDGPDRARARTEAQAAVSEARRAFESDPSQRGARVLEARARRLLAALNGTDERIAAAAFIRELDELVTLHPEAVDLRLERAWALEHLAAREEDSNRNLSRAIADLEAAVRRSPSDATLLESMGRLRQKAGDSEGALADLTRALEIDPSRVPCRVRRGSLLRARAAETDDRSLLRAALKDLEGAVKNAPRLAGARAELGHVLFELRDWKGALEEYAQAAALDPGLLEGLRGRRAECLRRARNP